MNPNLVELTRGGYEAFNRRDFDSLIGLYAPDAIWEGWEAWDTFEGGDSIRGFLEDWRGSFERLEVEPEEIVDLGNGVVFSAIRQEVRPFGTSGQLLVRKARVTRWVGARVVRTTLYADAGEARVAAEHFAGETA